MSVEHRKQEIARLYGPWTAHNIQLSDNVFTISPDHHFNTAKRAEVYLSILHHSRRFDTTYPLKVLDLGCLEGGISIYFAQRGFSTYGVDIRDSNLKKCRFVADELMLRNCQWELADVTDQDFWNQLPPFDLIICSGLLYHLDAPSLPTLTSNIFSHLKDSGLLIIDTNITSKLEARYTVNADLSLYGRYYNEFHESASLQERTDSIWSSYHNDKSFWLTERSLTNLLSYSGFSFIARALYPYHEWSHINRDIWYAVKSDIPCDQPYKSEPDQRPLEHRSFLQ